MTGPGPAPLLREAARDRHGAYWQDWYCEPPPAGCLFSVLNQEWDDTGDGIDGIPVRRIYEIARIPDARTAAPPGTAGVS